MNMPLLVDKVVSTLILDKRGLMKKLLFAIILLVSLSFALNVAATHAQTIDQNQFLQQYLQSKQQQQVQQAQSQQAQQNTTQQAQQTTQSRLSGWEIVILVVYIVTIILAWTNLILGIIALVRWLKQKKAQTAMFTKRLM